MYHFIIDPNRGKKWYYFYTKVRPWASAAMGLLSTLMLFLVWLVPELFPYPGLAFVLNLLNIAHAVLCIILFVKSFGDAYDLVEYINVMLICETVYLPLSLLLQTMISDETFLASLIIALIFSAPVYFLWYRLNRKYFEERLVCTNPPTEEERAAYMQAKETNADPESIRICLSKDDPDAPNPNESMLFQPPENKDDELDLEYVEYEYDDDEIDYDDDEIEEELKTPNFCRKCGNKLAPDSVFCSNCGTKVK